MSHPTRPVVTREPENKPYILPLSDSIPHRVRVAPISDPIAANIGVGVTQEAQDIFDALARTLPCRWRDRDIVVMDEVVIAAPYASCAGVAGGDPRAVERVQKVLANEKKKLGL